MSPADAAGVVGSGIAENIRNTGGRRRQVALRNDTRPAPGRGSRLLNSPGGHLVGGTPRAAAGGTGVHVLDILCLGLFEPAQHGLSQKAVEIARPFGFPITNSMVVTWIVALGLIVFAQLATRRMTQVPGGAQNFLEWLVEGLYGLLESIIGRHLVERTFWFFATIFIFILAANWVGLIPGVGTIGWGHQTDARLRHRAAAVPRRQRRSQHDAGDGAGVLRLLDRLGAAGSRRRRHAQGAVRAEGRDHRRCWAADDRRVLRRRAAWRSSRSCSGRCR